MGFIAIPQYATERILREELAMHGVRIQRGLRVEGFEQDTDGVTATVVGDGGRQTARSAYLIGADADNLAWKVALVLSGDGAPGLLDSYDAERRPVGEEVVGRTVRSAREGIGADSTDPDFVIRREAQLLISHVDSPIVADGAEGRAPDASGLMRASVSGPAVGLRRAA